MADLTADRLLDGRVRLAQPAKGYRVAIDPVLLAAATLAAPGDDVLDAGCGTGAAAMCLLARVPGCRIAGLECQADIAEIARLNLSANGWQDWARILCGDLADPPSPLKGTSFDHVMSNPPFRPAGQGTLSPSPGIRLAHAESMSLRDWVAACLRRLRPGGWLTLIHRADRAAELCAALLPAAGDIGLFPIWPKLGSAPAGRLLVRARKGSHGPARVARGLVLHRDDGGYTAEAEAVLRHGAALAWP